MSRGLQADDTAPQRANSDPERPESSPAGAQPGIEDQRLNTGGYRVSLPMFEGPLDLLLHLVQKHELDILNIPISFITEKYVEYIQLLDALNIDLASEYLVMAATLVHIKSRMLLPNPPADESGDGTEEDELDPRAELVRRLLEYQKYKLAAEQLGGRSILGRDVFPRGSSDQVAGGEAPLEGLASFKLLDAFQAVLERTKKTRDHQIDFERFSLSDKISELSELLQRTRRLVFHELFAERASRAELIITFLALLEMTRLRLTRLRQDGPLEPIYIELTVNDDAFPTDEEVLTVGTADDVAEPEVLLVDTAADIAATEVGATEVTDDELSFEDAVLADAAADEAEADGVLPIDPAQSIGAVAEELAVEDAAPEHATPIDPADVAVSESAERELTNDEAATEGFLPVDTAADVEATEDAAEELVTDDAGWTDTAATEVAAIEIPDDELELEDAVLAYAADGKVADVLEADGVLSVEPDQLIGAVPVKLAVEDAAPEHATPIDPADVAVSESVERELTNDEAATEGFLPVDTAADVEATEDAAEELVTDDAGWTDITAGDAFAEERQAVGATTVDALGLPTPPEAVPEPAAHDDASPLDHEDTQPIDTAAADAATKDAPPEALEQRAEELEPRLAADPREYE